MLKSARIKIGVWASKIRVSQELQLPKEASVAKKPEYVKPLWMEEMVLHIGVSWYPSCLPDLILEFSLSLVPLVALTLTLLVFIIWLGLLVLL